MPGIGQRSCGKPGARLFLSLSKRQDCYAIRIGHIVGCAELRFRVTPSTDEATSAPRASPGAPVVSEMETLQDQAVIGSFARSQICPCGTGGEVGVFDGAGHVPSLAIFPQLFPNIWDGQEWTCTDILTRTFF